MTNNLIKIITLTSFIVVVGFIFLLEPIQAADPIQFKPQITIDGQFKAGQAMTVSNSTQTIAEYVRAIYKYAMATVGIVAVVVMMIGGFLWITAAGNSAQIDNAKSYIAGSLTGLLLVMCSYMILKTVNPSLVDFKTSSVKKVEANQASNTFFGIQEGQVNEGAARETIKQANLSASSHGIDFKPACREGQTTGCVNFNGMREQTIAEVINLDRLCTTCDRRTAAAAIFITGGTEGGHASGDFSHEKGYKIDLRLNPGLDAYIINNFQAEGVRKGDGAKLYRAPSGALYALEGDHWDILVK